MRTVAAQDQQQQEAVVEALAHVLAAEDARNYDGPLLRNAAHHPDPLVRRHAALALGRIRNRAGGTTLLELLADADTAVQADAAFALGLIGDSTAIPRLRQYVLDAPPDAAAGAAAEAVTAIAQIGGSGATQFVTDLLSRAAPFVSSAQVPPATQRALEESWRLGAGAPVSRIAPFATAHDPDARWRSIYSLARLRSTSAADALLAALNDSLPLIRATAVRELTATYADSAKLDRRALATSVRHLVADADPQVRIAALRALATYRSEALAPAAIERATDTDPNVRVQALAALGQLGGPDARTALVARLGAGPFAIRRQALLSLAAVSKEEALKRAAGWLGESDWRLRAVAADALGLIGTDSATSMLEGLIAEKDGRVAAAAFSAVTVADSLRARVLARGLLSHPDPVLRAEAASVVAAAPRSADLPTLIEAYGLSTRDPIPDARLAVISALGRLAELDPSGSAKVTEAFARRFPKGTDYLARRAAARDFPGLAARWGPAFPVETGLEVGDYRDIARHLIWPADRGAALPGIVIETDRGSIGIALLVADAPITVNALLRLVERRYFDGGTWQRIVPGFVAQDGDPRGDGSGGPGYALRDELNPHRYQTGTVGMALDGPDTGGSQFFITLAPQPHLNGSYTVFGRVDSGADVLAQLVQGDRIRRVRIRS